jgi:hypothetical protein
MTAIERYQRIRASLIAQGASAGTIDAFADVVRHLEDAAIATHIDAVAGDPCYILGQADPEAVRRTADQIRTFRA